MLMLPSNDPPCKILDGGVVLVLTNTVISMDVDVGHILGSMALEVVVEEADGTVCPLAHIVCFVNKVVNLCALRFTSDSDNLVLASCQKISRSWLQWVVGVVDLLCKII